MDPVHAKVAVMYACMVFNFENTHQSCLKKHSKISPKTSPKSLQKPIPKRYENLRIHRSEIFPPPGRFAYIYIYDFGAGFGS